MQMRLLTGRDSFEESLSFASQARLVTIFLITSGVRIYYYQFILGNYFAQK